MSRVVVTVRPKPGDPRPPGRGRRAGAAGARLRRGRGRAGRQAASSSTWRTRRSCDDMCRKLLANALIEDYGIEVAREARRRHLPRARCDDESALAASGRSRRGRLRSGTATATCRASTASSCPAASPTATTCAPARSRASRRSWRRSSPFAKRGGPVLGICNGFQVLCEAGLLPGRAAAQQGPPLRLPPGRPRGPDVGTPFTSAWRSGSACRSRPST